MTTADVLFTRRLAGFPRITTGEWSMVGQDGGQSISLGDETLFVFSDTLITAPGEPEGLPRVSGGGGAPCWFLANCAAVGTGTDLRTSLAGLRYLGDADGFPREIVVATDAERDTGLRFWPLHGTVVDGLVHLFYVGVETTDGSTTWGFENRGVGIAVLDPVTGAVDRVRRNGDWRLWPAMGDDFHFGVQVLPVGDDLYVFGSHRRGIDVEGLVGKVAPEAVTDPGAYRFLGTGGRWVASPDEATSLGRAGSDYSVSWNPHLGAYLMLYVDSFSKELTIRLADEVTGPYSPPQRIARVPHHATSELVYLAFEHAEFAAENGRRIYASYCQPYFAMNSLVEIRFA
jgi:hypothetical protein